MHAHLDEYVKTIVEYDTGIKGVTMDLVELLHNPTLVSASPRIKHIWFTDPSELPSLVVSPSAVARSNASRQMQPSATRSIQAPRREAPEQKIQQEPKVELVKEVHEEPQELAPEEPMLTLEQVHVEETSAAVRIQAAYRGYSTRRETTFPIVRESDTQRNAIFIICLQNLYASGWERTAYRNLYLWALPRLVVCLDRVIGIAHEFKDKTKRSYSESSDERLEQVKKQMDMIR